MRGLQRGRRSDAAILILTVCLAGACATPIGVTKGTPQSVYHDLTASVLSTGRPSATSEQVLQRAGAAERFKTYPEAVLSELRGSGAELSRDHIFALAELSFLHGENSQKREYYLAAAVYAYAFLFPERDADASNPVDPRLRLAANLYNLGLTLGLTAPGGGRLALGPGPRALPFGQLEIAANPTELQWGGYWLSGFIPVAEYEVRGLRNRYRQPGVGAPFAAQVGPSGTGPEAEAARKRIPPRIKVAGTAFLRIERPVEALATGQVRGQLEIYAADKALTVDIDGQVVPLEVEPTATLALTLEGAPVWDTELGGFLSADRHQFKEGLVLLHPYRPGRVPVVLIHGTVSSPARWAEMLNELENDPVLRERLQFWLFTYNTSSPILLSSSDLREGLRQTLLEVDPEGRDPALRTVVLIGHSQGGLLARIMVSDSGTRFWDGVSRVPLAEVKASPETHALLERTMFFKPLPFVKRVVFIATPHQGSFRVGTFIREIVRWVVTLPVTLVRGMKELAEENPQLEVGDLPTAVDNMRPGHRFLRNLSASPIADGVTVHSVIAVRGDGPISSLGDGVVNYESAHLEGVASEKVVRSGHSTQGEPATIEEVRRILREHISAWDRTRSRESADTQQPTKEERR